MSKPEILEKSPMSIPEVKEALESINKELAEDEELNFRAGKTLEYAQELATLKPKKAKELYKKLLELDIPRFKELHAQKVVDILPQSDKQVKMVLGSYHMTISNENAKKIVSAVKEFL